MIRLTTEGLPREPEGLRAKMNACRRGERNMPQEYIDYHANLARPELAAVAAKHGLQIHRSWMEGDGWMDGMRALHAVVETRSGRLLKLQWCDSNLAFMVHCDSGGWASMNEEDVR